MMQVIVTTCKMEKTETGYMSVEESRPSNSRKTLILCVAGFGVAVIIVVTVLAVAIPLGVVLNRGW